MMGRAQRGDMTGSTISTWCVTWHWSLHRSPALSAASAAGAAPRGLCASPEQMTCRTEEGAHQGMV